MSTCNSASLGMPSRVAVFLAPSRAVNSRGTEHIDLMRTVGSCAPNLGTSVPAHVTDEEVEALEQLDGPVT